MHLELAAGPVSWGVDFADDPGNPPWSEVLDGIRDCGLRALELGPLGYLPTDGAALREELARRRLDVVGSFVFDDLHEPARRDATIAHAERVCRWVARSGGELLVVIDRPSAQRAATAGRNELARRLSPRRWSAMMETIDRVAALARRHGLRPVLHHHAGSCIEFADELEAALDATEIDLCLDTGHALYAGIDPVELISRYGRRIGHLHLKDLDRRLLQDGAPGYWANVARGVFCPIGAGTLDLRGIVDALRVLGYRGFATIEQDRRPSTAGSPVEHLRASIERLARAGVGAPA
jgi:inosose dehydratase